MNYLDLHCSRNELARATEYSSPGAVPGSRRTVRGTFHKLSQLYVENIQREKKNGSGQK